MGPHEKADGSAVPERTMVGVVVASKVSPEDGWVKEGNECASWSALAASACRPRKRQRLREADRHPDKVAQDPHEAGRLAGSLGVLMSKAVRSVVDSHRISRAQRLLERGIRIRKARVRISQYHCKPF